MTRRVRKWRGGVPVRCKRRKRNLLKKMPGGHKCKAKSKQKASIWERYGRKKGRQLPAKVAYARYLQSPEWRKRRERALKRSDYKCQDCGAVYGLSVHHLTYARVGDEREEDLIVLCKGCHRKRHPEIDAPTDSS